MSKTKVLISAAGSPLGQSIFKALSISTLNLELYFSDISPFAAGFKMNDASRNVIFPPVADQEFQTQFFDFVDSNKIDVFFPTINPEYKFIESNRKAFEDRGLKVAACDSALYQLCSDKYKCIEFLQRKGVKVPYTAEVALDANLKEILNEKETLFLKPRFGVSSKDLFKVNSLEEFEKVVSRYPSNYFIAQEYLKEEEEYTIGAYRARKNDFYDCLIIKRELKFGLSYSGEILENQSIVDYCKAICSALDSRFSINIQLRLKNKQPLVFEINPRLSSTTSIRAHYGLNEPEFMIMELLGRENEIKSKKQSGKFSRYWEEFYY